MPKNGSNTLSTALRRDNRGILQGSTVDILRQIILQASRQFNVVNFKFFFIAHVEIRNQTFIDRISLWNISKLIKKFCPDREVIRLLVVYRANLRQIEDFRERRV
jgi:hypothetical protein